MYLTVAVKISRGRLRLASAYVNATAKHTDKWGASLVVVRRTNEIGLTFQDPPAAVALALADALPRSRAASLA